MNENISETATREGRIDAAIAEFLIAKQEGRPFDRAEWLARHAEFADELREFVTDEEQVAGILAPVHGGAETITHADRDGSTESLSGPRGFAGPLTLPVSVGDYELLEEIARGGMGVVFKAWQKSLKRIVALKMVLGNRLASVSSRRCTTSCIAPMPRRQSDAEFGPVSRIYSNTVSVILVGMFWEGVKTLVERAKRGDRQALDRLYEMAQPYMLRQAQKAIGSGWPNKSVSDLTQETWVRAWQGIGDFMGAESDADTGALLRAWLAQTMKNVWRNDIRFDNAQCRKPLHGIVPLFGGATNESSQPGNDPPIPDPTPSENLYKKEQCTLLDRAIEKLPEPCDRDIVRQRFFEELSFAQIGERLKLDESTIRYRLHRILEFLGDELKELP